MKPAGGAHFHQHNNTCTYIICVYLLKHNTCVHIPIYIYIHGLLYICIYIYIYIYNIAHVVHQASNPQPASACDPTARSEKATLPRLCRGPGWAGALLAQTARSRARLVAPTHKIRSPMLKSLLKASILGSGFFSCLSVVGAGALSLRLSERLRRSRRRMRPDALLELATDCTDRPRRSSSWRRALSRDRMNMPPVPPPPCPACSLRPRRLPPLLLRSGEQCWEPLLVETSDQDPSFGLGAFLPCLGSD